MGDLREPPVAGLSLYSQWPHRQTVLPRCAQSKRSPLHHKDERGRKKNETKQPDAEEAS